MARDETFFQEIGTIEVSTVSAGSKSEHKAFVFIPERTRWQWYELRSETKLLFPDVENDELAEFVGKKVNVVAKKLGGRKLLVGLVTVA